MKLRKPILLTLIALGLCAIGVSVYLQYGKPYMREVGVQKQDETRIADLDALNTSIQAILTASSTASTSSPQATNIGNANTVYISLPSATSTCADLELPSLPDGWSYHCATSADLQKTDGTGWLPTALAIAALPIDPINNADTLNYYAFVTSPAGWEAATSTLQLRSGQAASTATSNSSRPSQNATEGTAGQATTTVTVATSTQSSSAPASAEASERTQQGSGETKYVLTAVLDSKKYLTEKAQEDGGFDDAKYEVGNNLKIWREAIGLLAYLPFNENGGDVAHDQSGNGNDIYLPVDNLYSNEDCLLKNCLSNNSNKDISIYFPSMIPISRTISLSYQIWFKINQKIPRTSAQIFNPGTNRLDFNIEGNSGAIFLWFHDQNNIGNLLYKSSPHEYTDNLWHQLLVSKNADSIIVYLDGRRVSKFLTSNSTRDDNTLAFISLPIGTSINSLGLYNRSLSSEDALNNFSLVAK